jgi:hypothetical protein
MKITILKLYNKMQNKFPISKLNTGLLVILIILMIIALRWMWGNKQMYGTQVRDQSFGQDYQLQEKTPPIKQSDIKENTKAVVLRKFINADASSGIPVQECIAEGESYFEVMNSYVDGDNLLYNKNGEFAGSCGGGRRPAGSPNQIMTAPQCSQLANCKVVYGPNDSGTFVDFYHIKK